jgi:DNA-binding response OmpR family regulator
MEVVRVLLVDDEAEFIETLGLRLESRGLATVTALSGDEALEKLEDEDFDVVVLDIFMPGRDGLETLREVKSRKPLTEVIMLSGKGTEEAAIDGMRLGAFDFLTKPPDIDVLVVKIGDAYAKREEQLARIQSALEAEKVQAGVVVEGGHSEGPTEEESPEVDGGPRQGRLLVLGRESEFSEALIDHALAMAERLSYEILALNAAGFADESFRSFPAARERVWRDFRRVSGENVVPFRQQALRKNIPFTHVVKFSGPDQATQELRQEVGPIDFVVSEPAGDLVGSNASPGILVYSLA